MSANDTETVEGEGRVTSLVGGTACPALRFVIERVTVATNAATVYERGVCRDVQPGALLHVRGTQQADGTVVAALVRIEESTIDGEGRVTSLIGGTVCPTLQFVVEAIIVKTSPATRYESGVCADIQIGTKIEAEGTRLADGTVLALRIKIEEREVEGEGRVTSLVGGTACPALRFVIENNVIVATNLATVYERGACGDVAPGVLLHVKGTQQADGTVVAARVRIPESKIEGEGHIASLVRGTACPTLQFVVETVTVTTDVTTVYERGTCADLQPGVEVHVRATRRANETVLAEFVRIDR